MRSIRLSLICYFLGLLLLALGVASLLVYQSAESTLQAKEEATVELIQARFAQRRAEARREVDDRLLGQAFTLAGRVKVDIDYGSNRYRPLHVLGAVTALPSPMGHLAAAPWLLQSSYNPNLRKERTDKPRSWRLPPAFANEVWRHGLAHIRLTKSELETPAGRGPAVRYYQIDANLSVPPLRSASLGGLSFPRPEGFGGDHPKHWEADDFALAPGRMVRRVRVKATNTRLEFLPGWGNGRAGPTPDRVGPPSRADSPPAPARPRGSRPGPPQLSVTLQVAADHAMLESKLDQLVLDRDEELEATAAETRSALARLRQRLAAIALATFGATILGTCWLVWAGLRPLNRLSEAVSKVSPRDFHLPLEPGSLPLELRPVTEKLTAALDQLGRAFEREKQATADISHELRTPLAALLTTCELALRRQRTAEQFREMFSDCLASARYLHQIVERLLTLARLDAGVDKCRAQAVDVAEVADQCAAVIRPLAEAQGLTLTVSRAPQGTGPARASTDPDKLREVMSNLLHNAIQYNRPEGRIDLTVSRQNGHVRFAVADTGVGIPAESRGRIFERFYRADPSRNTDNMHAGLGLAIVKEYIDVMGGRIEVRSQEGEGTVFEVDLPAAVPPEGL